MKITRSPPFQAGDGSTREGMIALSNGQAVGLYSWPDGRWELYDGSQSRGCASTMFDSFEAAKLAAEMME